MYRDANDFASGEITTIENTSQPLVLMARRRPWFFPYSDDTRRVLSAAHMLVTQGWTKGSYATDKDDRPIQWSSDRAFNVCAIGALKRANMKLPAPRFLSWLWRDYRYGQAVRLLCLAIDVKECADTYEDRRVAIERWNDYAHYTSVDTGFKIAITIA